MHAPSANTDEGSGFGAKNITTDSELAAAQQAYYPKLTNSSVASLFELYPNDPSQGCPFNTGDGLLASGYQDKRSNALTGCVPLRIPSFRVQLC